MKTYLKYIAVFACGLVCAKVSARVGYLLLIKAAEQCLTDYPTIPSHLIHVCMEEQHPIKFVIGKLLNLTF